MMLHELVQEPAVGTLAVTGWSPAGPPPGWFVGEPNQQKKTKSRTIVHLGTHALQG